MHNKYYSSFSYEHSYKLTRVGGGDLLNEYPDPIEGISGTVIICEPINKDNISKEKKTEIKTGRVKINSKDYTISYTYNLTYYYEDFGGSGLSFNKYIVKTVPVWVPFFYSFAGVVKKPVFVWVLQKP